MNLPKYQQIMNGLSNENWPWISYCEWWLHVRIRSLRIHGSETADKLWRQEHVIEWKLLLMVVDSYYLLQIGNEYYYIYSYW